MILDREMIQKYKLVRQGNQTDGVMLFPSSNGEYVKYNDYLREIELFKDRVSNLQQTKEDLIQVIVDLNKTISNKEFEITAISDRLNKMYLGIEDNS